MAITTKVMLTIVVMLSPIPKQTNEVKNLKNASIDNMTFHLTSSSREDSINQTTVNM